MTAGSDVVLGVLAALGGSDCETLQNGLLAQPVNALSSMGFVVAGALIASTNPVGRRRMPSHLLGAVVATIGIGSVAFHGPQPVGADVLHDAPIYLTASFFVVHSIRRPLGLRSLTMALTLLATGAVAYLLGRTGAPLCAPDSLLQPHAVWHLLVAAALWAWWREAAEAPGRLRGASTAPSDAVGRAHDTAPTD